MRDAYPAASNRNQDSRHHWPQEKCGRQTDGLQAKRQKAGDDGKYRPLLADGLMAAGSIRLLVVHVAPSIWPNASEHVARHGERGEIAAVVPTFVVWRHSGMADVKYRLCNIGLS